MSTVAVNQARLNKMIINHRLSHAFIFTGDDDKGKKETVLWFAKRLFCPYVQEGEPCQKCDYCRRIQQHDFVDIKYLKPEGKTIKVSQIEALKHSLSLSALEGEIQLCVIEEAETMTETSSNQLLKFIEEPPTPIIFILLTHNETQLLTTIVSRCQRLSFTRPLFLESSPLAMVEKQLMLENEEIDFKLQESLYERVYEWYQLLMHRDFQAFVFVQTSLLEERELWPKEKGSMMEEMVLFILLILAKNDYLNKNKPQAKQLLSHIEEAKIKLNHHVHFQAVLEQIAYYMMKGREQ